MKILIEAMHGIGDLICMLPMINAVKKKYSESEIDIVLNSNTAIDVIKHSGIDVNNIYVMNLHKSLMMSLKTYFSIRKNRYEIAISAANTPVKKAKLFMFFLKVRKKIGIQFSMKKNYNMLNDTYHFVDANFLAVKELGIEAENKNPKLFLDQSFVEETKSKFSITSDKDYIGLCIGRADVLRYRRCFSKKTVYTRSWGTNLYEHSNNMGKLISRLSENYHVILFGGQLEKEISDNLEVDSTKVINLVGCTNLSESMALASMCKYVIGVDTGMIHVSDALGVRTISLFGPTNPKTHGAYSHNAIYVGSEFSCKNCYGTKKYSNCNDRKCMNLIKVEDIIMRID